MQKFGFVFPGQGSQKLGMLSELANVHPQVTETFAEASDTLGLDLWQIAQTDSENLLDQTRITQPVLLTASVAIWRLWQSQSERQPAIMAGHSLGEYSALACAGVISFADALRLVKRRGEFMQQAVKPGTGSMAAIVGMDDGQISEICRQVAGDDVVAPANYNSPGQTVIAGDKSAVERAMQACRDAGAKRALLLNVSVPSHCDLMKPAAEQLTAELEAVDFRSAAFPVVQNVNAGVSESASEIKKNLLQQLFMPVLWVDSVRHMQQTGVTRLVECGPGKVLCGLVKRIAPEIVCMGSDDSASLLQATQEVLLS